MWHTARLKCAWAKKPKLDLHTNGGHASPSHPALAAASNASVLKYPSEPWIRFRWYQTSIHSKIASRASAWLRKVRPCTSSFFRIALEDHGALHHRVVVAVAGPARALPHAPDLHGGLEQLATVAVGVLDAAVGVVHEAIRRVSPADRHP
jgi:hypothetical protein